MSCSSCEIASLPLDVLMRITDFCHVQDICNLSMINKRMHTKLHTIGHYILKKQFYAFHQLDARNTSCKNVDAFLRSSMETFSDQMYTRYWEQYQIHDPCCKTAEFKEYLQETLPHLKIIYAHGIIDALYKDIFLFIVKNGSLNNYPSIINIFACYVFLQILYNTIPNYNNIDYIISFLDRLTLYRNSKYTSLATSYYNFLHNYYYQQSDNIRSIDRLPQQISFFTISLENFYLMSKLVTSVCVLKRLIGYKPLELSHTLLIRCCSRCNNVQSAKHLVNTRYNISDNVVGHNYSEIKGILFNQNRNLYQLICAEEVAIIDKNIFIFDPITRNNISITSNYFRKLVKRLERTNEGFYQKKLHRDIYKKRLALLTEYFY